MAHEIFLDDVVVIKRKFKIPDRCPRCRRLFELGDAVLRSQRMRPREETLRLTTVLDDTQLREVVEVKDRSGFEEYPNFLVEISCISCNHIFYRTHKRMYVLEEMDRTMAFKLRGLLYNSNVQEPLIRKKCYDETEGYHGDCLACNIEAEIGTEEVPHPIDVRVHSCKESSA